MCCHLCDLGILSVNNSQIHTRGACVCKSHIRAVRTRLKYISCFSESEGLHEKPEPGERFPGPCTCPKTCRGASRWGATRLTPDVRFGNVKGNLLHPWRKQGSGCQVLGPPHLRIFRDVTCVQRARAKTLTFGASFSARRGRVDQPGLIIRPQ